MPDVSRTPAPKRPGLETLQWLATLLSLLLVAAFVAYVWSEKAIDRANELRHQSFLLTNELQKSSDELTRMVRTYVVTGEARYKQAYETILALREGTLSKPAGYGPMYWDRVLADPSHVPDASGPAVALLAQMRAAGFTPTELQGLTQAKHNSDQLTRIERDAMALVDSAAPADLPEARRRASLLLHDSAYHASKAAIMQPIGEVTRSVEQRTHEALVIAKRNAASLRALFLGIGIALVGVVLGGLWRLRRLLGAPADLIYAHIARIGMGDFSGAMPVTNANRNSVLGWLASTQDQLRELQTQRDCERLALKDSESRLNSIIQSEPACIKIVDGQGNLVQMNPAGLEMIQADAPEQVVGRPVLDLIAPEYHAAFAALHQRVIAGERAELEFEIVGLRGVRRWLHTHAVPLRHEGKTVHLALTSDVTERKRAEHQIQQLAFYDPLTGLPNRHLLMDRLRQAISALRRRGAHDALIMLDLDNFKAVNDSWGHLVGDKLLLEVAQRLRSCIREGDTVARFGGDEFVIILGDLEASGMAALQAEAVGFKLLDRLKEPYALEQQHPDGSVSARTHYCSASLGICMFTDDSVSIDELLKRADTAMYQAKAAGRNTLRFFDAQVQNQVSEHAELESDLRVAAQQGQLVLHYQPQVTHDGRIIGTEALVRWFHPRRGLLMPAAFIALAEESGMILEVGQWVLETACAQLASWSRSDATRALTLAVNVSALQFGQDDFVENVLQTLTQTGAPAQRLKLELTESLLIQDVEGTISKMSALKAVGVGFSLDDFGTGYSSLYHLKRLPLDQLKIDQSFVRNITADNNDAAIARMIMALAQSMGLGVIAEGVEKAEQAEFLQGLGCHTFQGYLFGRPMPVQEFQDRVVAPVA